MDSAHAIVSKATGLVMSSTLTGEHPKNLPQ
jgi:hypothetical protein